MRLKFSLARTGRDIVDLAATVDATVTVGDLAAALDRCDPERDHRRTPAVPDVNRGSSRLSLRVHNGTAASGPSTVLSAGLPLSVSGLRSGSLVSIAAVSERFKTPGADRGSAAATLSVLSGPDVGKEVPLAEGTSILGRDASCDVKLSDPLISKRHARITISDVAEIVDTGSANGLIIGGSLVPRAVLRPQDRVIVGETALGITVHRSVAASLAQTTDVDFNRSPRLDPTFAGEEFTAPDPPEKPQHQRFPLIAMVAPLIMGLVLYVFTRSLLSILFIGLSPLLMVGNYVDNKIQNRRVARESDAQFAEAVQVLRQDLANALARERVGRLAEAPSTAEAIDAMRRQTPLLWTRRREHDRILTVRLGVGEQPSRHTVELPTKSRAQPRHWLQLQALRADAAFVQGVPVVADLRECGSIGVAGPRPAATGVARGVLMQLAALHSPADLAVAAFLSSDTTDDWGWLKWLPHNRSPYSPLTGPHLAGEAAAGLRLVAELEELIDQRSAEDQRDAGERLFPAILVVVEDRSPVERSRLVGLAEHGPAAGVHLLWIAGSQDRLPAACRTYVAVDASSGAVNAGFVTTGSDVSPVICETVDAGAAMAAARALAPVSDAGVRVEDDSDLPRSMSFLTLIGPELAEDPAAVVDRWRESESIVDRASGKPARRRNLSLRAVVGQAAGEPLTLDLRSQGPHALVGGTTGAGKSEFLQSWVLGMAAGYSPDILTFLFVDYKGGAAFADCINLPHSVGMVTDLSPHLVRRALTSLNAELRYREHILNAKKAKDLLELHRKGDPEAPPSLVIVVDEFAALVQEVPEFVDGVVNVAQRGRSLGLHLILATQRPAGVIKDNLRANTNLRVALRMADEADSTDVLGLPLAASFSPDIPGRGAAKTGPGRITGFQTGYVGGWTSTQELPAQIDLQEMSFGTGHSWEEPAVDGAGADTDLGPPDISRMVSTISDAARRTSIPAPRRPWLPELSPIYDLQLLVQRRDSELAFGVVDDPTRQEQRPVYFNPDVDGNMAVYGTSGSGKSTLLRAVANAAGITPRSGPCQVYGLDFGSAGLRMLESLPHVGSIISGDDTERVERLVRSLKATLDDRVSRFSSLRAANITEYRTVSNNELEPRILVLIDGFSAFREQFESSTRNSVYSTLTNLVSDGRSVGIHFVVSADRVNSIPSAISSSIQRRIVLRMAESGDYSMLGVGADILNSMSPPGRGVVDGLELQTAVLGGSAKTTSQAAAIETLAKAIHKQNRPAAPRIARLPDQLFMSDLPTTVDGKVVIGLRDDNLEPFGLDLSGVLILAGPPQSGRTTALTTISTAIRRARPAVDMTYLGNRRSALPGLGFWKSMAFDEEEISVVAGNLVELIKTGRLPAGKQVIVVEGISENLGSRTDAVMATLVDECRRHEQFVVAESEISTFGQYGDALRSLKAERRGIILQPNSEDGDALLRTTLPRLRRSDFPAGRGFLVASGRCLRVQIARPE